MTTTFGSTSSNSVPSSSLSAAPASPAIGAAAGESLEAIFCDPQLGGRMMTCTTGQVLCEPDHPATDVFFVHKGQVRLHQVAPDGSSLLLEILGPGQWFGIAAIAGKEACQIRATAVSPSVVTKVAARTMMSHVCLSPEGARALIRELAVRQCATYDDTARLVFDDCNSRLIKTLLRFSDTAAASKQADGDGIVLRITHQQLAQAVGVARETVSLALTQLRKQNVVRTGRNQLFFDPEALRNFQARGTTSTPATGEPSAAAAV